MCLNACFWYHLTKNVEFAIEICKKKTLLYAGYASIRNGLLTVLQKHGKHNWFIQSIGNVPEDLNGMF